MSRDLLVLVLLLALNCNSSRADQHGVVLLYHHVSELTPASTSVTPVQFAQHLDYLEQNGFVVMPLSAMLRALYSGESLPRNAVAITFDDAYESVFTQAWPLLASRRMPFTVFVATTAIDDGYAGYMSWEQMRELDQALVSFGAHSVSHPHLVERRENESAEQWRSRAETEIRSSSKRIKAELSVEVDSFAYPYGEYDGALAAIVQAADLYGLAQHSGAVGPQVDAREVPRFPMASGYDDLQRFATAVNARPLPVVQSGPNVVLVSPDDVPEAVFLHLNEGPWQRTELACYSTTGSRLSLTAVERGYRVTLPPLRPGRNKINCTAPSSEKSGEYFWYSRLWIVTDEQGAWLQK